MNGVLWTPRAEIELEDIAFYIAVRDARPTVASKLIDEIVAKSQQYANQPLMGTIHSALGSRYRIFRHTRYVIVYEPLDKGIIVHRVVDGTQDFRRLFRDL
ncbi:MAG: type II toxin-antitoxin system RelE/ParE family toxin [Fuerstia sp.]|nr:type II toxin-antitoxin system RelE/ParE family toxin [Fuerstiella sp.]